MLIDKSKFMVLVAAIAASTAGCIINDSDGDAEGGGGEGASGPTTTSSAQGGGGTGGDSTTSQGGGGTGGDSTSQGGGGTGGGAECLGDEGTPDACSSECEEVIDNCASLASLKDGVAVQVSACLNGLDDATCSAELDGWGGCFQEGLAAACHDATVETPCSELATTCTITDDAAWQTECSSYLSGLSVSGREAVIGCFEDNCANDFSLEFCTSYAYYL